MTQDVSLPTRFAADPTGRHRVLDPRPVLPQGADRLDTDPALGDDEVLVRVERLNLDAASYRNLAEEAMVDGRVDGAQVRRRVLDIIAARGKMQNPVTGSGGMLIGTVAEVGPRSPLGLRVGDRVATLVSLTLTPLHIDDGLTRWDGLGEQVPTGGHAVLFGRSIAARLPDDLPDELALSILDVCGAPALTARVVRERSATRVLVVGAGGKSGSLSLCAARAAGATEVIGIVPDQGEHDALVASGLADRVVIADATSPLALRDAVARTGDAAEVTVVCVDVPGCEPGAILATRPGGTIIFFSMATSFSAAALGAEGLAADVTMLIGNGYVPGHAELALDLFRRHPELAALFARRIR
ncbi:L-erythro-3,5-diaminohexanoate dehydrogenase [Nocardioides daejeonensis]|uniref:L-erythro-3,5-diaminohexanoate dehydrogenase n=1 Tax=Nocardioides daejeonensis TaxID=1046556 RepID=UPI000D74DD33|nr:L-erythro-3,5-diaminohexanoate dehydrogenase [Nocardioides daejeonensis]